MAFFQAQGWEKVSKHKLAERKLSIFVLKMLDKQGWIMQHITHLNMAFKLGYFGKWGDPKVYVNVIRFRSSAPLKITLNPHEDSNVILKKEMTEIRT